MGLVGHFSASWQLLGPQLFLIPVVVVRGTVFARPRDEVSLMVSCRAVFRMWVLRVVAYRPSATPKLSRDLW